MRVLVTGPGRLGRPLLAALVRQGVTGAVLHRGPEAALPPGWRSIRADETRPSLPHDEALRNAPRQAGGLFVVPKIVE